MIIKYKIKFDTNWKAMHVISFEDESIFISILNIGRKHKRLKFQTNLPC